MNLVVFQDIIRKRQIVRVDGIRNKGRAIPARDLATAQERMRDWQKRVQP